MNYENGEEAEVKEVYQFEANEEAIADLIALEKSTSQWDSVLSVMFDEYQYA